MAERAAVYERLQVAAETTSGTGVAATKRLFTRGRLVPNIPITAVAAAGLKIPAAYVGGKEVTGISAEGAMSYNDLAYFFSAHYEAAVIATGVFTFTPDPSTPDTIKTLSVEQGSSVQGQKCNYGVVNSIALRFNLTQPTMQIQGFGRPYSENATVTVSPTEVPQAPVGPKEWYVQVGAAVGSLASLTRVKSAEFRSGGRWQPGNYAEQGQSSFSAHEEIASDLGITLVMQDNAAAEALLATLRAVTMQYVRLKATGASPRDLQITMPFVYTAPEGGDTEAVETRTFVLRPIYDPAYGQFIEVVLGTNLTSL